MTAVFSGIEQRFGKWRLVFALFLVVYTAILLLYLGYSPIRWDETPHLVGGLLLKQGEFQEYSQHYTFYPPLFDATTALNYTIIGASVFSARLVAVIFGLLSLCALFEYAYRVYEPKVALFSTILLASMPGFLVLCRMAMIETMLLFFFSTTLFLFFFWMRTKSRKMFLLSGVALVVGITAKYQILIAGVVMLAGMLFLWKGYLLKKLSKKLLIAIIAVAVAVPLLYLLLSHLTSGSVGEWLNAWLYAIQVGNVERSLYSERFPLPIFYLIEMTYPYSHVHPVSLPLYIISLCGLGFWAWRRRTEDKFSLIWFLVVYVVFTLIPNRNWRYVVPLFPILALSAADFLLFLWDKIKAKMGASKTSLQKSVFIKIAAIFFVVLIGASAVYSWSDAYSWVEQDHVHIPIDQSTQYVIENSAPTESIVVLFPGNYFSVDMVKFYLLVYDSGDRDIWPYPETAVDAFRPDLNVTFLIERCEASNVKYLLLYEYGNITYFDSDWKSYDVFDMLTDSGRFTSETVFGIFPRRVTILRFVSDS